MGGLLVSSSSPSTSMSSALMRTGPKSKKHQAYSLRSCTVNFLLLLVPATMAIGSRFVCSVLYDAWVGGGRDEPPLGHAA